MEDLVGCIFGVKHDTGEGKDGEAWSWCARDGVVNGGDRHGLDPAWRRMRGRGALSQTCTWFENGIFSDTSTIIMLRRAGMVKGWLLDVRMH